MNTNEAVVKTHDFWHSGQGTRYNEAESSQVQDMVYNNVHKLEPEGYLCLAVIKLAIADLKRDKLRKEVLRWINGECDKQDYFELPFEDCCAAVRLDASAARKAIKAGWVERER